jgi:hypothetical protein
MQLDEETKRDESVFNIVIIVKPSGAQVDQERSEQISYGQRKSWNC